MPLVLVTPPTVEPITIIQAKAHLRVEIPDDDALILDLVTAVRQYGEGICRRAFCTQSWKIVLDTWPSPGMNISSANWYGPNWGVSPGPLTTARPDGVTGYEIIPGVAQLQSVESVKYIDTNGVQQTLDPSQYKVDTVSPFGRVVPAYGTSWPSARNEINAVEVAFTSGYGNADAVPMGVKKWMLIRLATMFENREELAILQRGKVEPLAYVDRLLDQYRVFSF
jgi:hypothetical protein